MIAPGVRATAKRVLATHFPQNSGSTINSEREGNMKLAKYLSISALLVVPFAAQLNAQTLQANVAGSSVLWVEAGQGVYAGGNCAWTSTATGVTYTLDSRVSAPYNQENGNLWVAWTPGTGGTCAAPTSSSEVWAYISLDSIVGTRCLFAAPSCTLNTTAAAGTKGVNKLPGVTDTALPASVLAAFNGQPISIAATDLLPADAAFATYSTLALCGPLSSGTQFTGFGYGPGNVGTSILSYYSSAAFHVINFNVYGSDPITGNLIGPYSITPVGATPVIVAVNTTDANGFGSSAVTNVNRAQLGLLFSGIFIRTADVMPQAFAGLAAAYAGVTALLREPPSGEYNVIEHSIANNKEIYRSQDIGNCTTGAYGVTSNPMNTARTFVANSGGTGYRNRVIGTTEMISEIEAVEDSIGYAFWDAANWAGNTNVKYLTVDGIDPLFNTYSNGEIPDSANGLLPSVTLSHVADGTYPIWSELRFISITQGAGLAAPTLAGLTQAQVSFGSGATQPDFITTPNLHVFHAHFVPPFINFNHDCPVTGCYTNRAADGTRVCGPSMNGVPGEDGGDVGGLVFSQQAGADFCILKGNYGEQGGVGPTNTASFGVRQ
jgi:hypothetical protein